MVPIRRFICALLIAGEIVLPFLVFFSCPRAKAVLRYGRNEKIQRLAQRQIRQIARGDVGIAQRYLVITTPGSANPVQVQTAQ